MRSEFDHYNNVCVSMKFSFIVGKVYFPGISNKLHIKNKKCPSSILYLSKETASIKFSIQYDIGVQNEFS